MGVGVVNVKPLSPHHHGNASDGQKRWVTTGIKQFTIRSIPMKSWGKDLPSVISLKYLTFTTESGPAPQIRKPMLKML